MTSIINKTLIAATLASIGGLGVAHAERTAAETSDGRIALGYLNCEYTDGSSVIVKTDRSFDCLFTPAGNGPVERYQANVSNYGLDLMLTDEKTMRWAVLAPATFEDTGALEGDYGGISADAALGYSVGADVLVGGLQDSVALQPLALSTGEGLGAAVGYEQLTLIYSGMGENDPPAPG